MRQALVVTELLREIGGPRPGRVAFRSVAMTDHFPTPLGWRSFKLGSSDYDIPSDEAYCPCGAVVRPADDAVDLVLGDFVDAAEDHIAEQHQGVRT